MMNIRETNDLFYKRLIQHYKNIGDVESAKTNEVFHKKLKAQRNNLEDNNKEIVQEVTK
ncbi:hypothetical protein P5641_00045 (plasmid) [Bacillus subtilis]|nr:hypothetical protein P5641_00045 [Bacillus subtilis]